MSKYMKKGKSHTKKIIDKIYSSIFIMYWIEQKSEK